MLLKWNYIFFLFRGIKSCVMFEKIKLSNGVNPVEDRNSHETVWRARTEEERRAHGQGCHAEPSGWREPNVSQPQQWVESVPGAECGASNHVTWLGSVALIPWDPSLHHMIKSCACSQTSCFLWHYYILFHGLGAYAAICKRSSLNSQ